MNIRRQLLKLLGVGAIANVAAQLPSSRGTASATEHAPTSRLSSQATPSPAAPVAVHTPNGWTLPYRMNQGVKEFHLVAEEIEHEFAPGSSARCWGYNGTTPGPSIEAVEGDRVRIFVTNRLSEHTSIHWHGLLLPSGMDGVGGLSQPQIKPGETYAYEFTLRQHGTHMYHPHADEMVQMALGMMGMLIIHPREPVSPPVDRDYCILLHNWALHPGTYRPNPAVMVEFDLWTMNSKVFPAITPMVARSGERVRIRVGNLSMWNHPIHMHGTQFWVTGSDGGRWPQSAWRTESTEIVGVGQTRDLEFIAVPGDWIFHCHMSHHTMNAMGHDLPNPIGVEQSDLVEEIRQLLPGYTAMGKSGMAEHQRHTDMGHHPGPANTVPMMTGTGPFGKLEMGGMFTMIKVRDELAANDFRDPGWYRHPPGTGARRVSTDPHWGAPPSRKNS